MATAHLFGDDPESFSHNSSLKLGGEETVVTTQQEPGRHLRPSVERPGLLERRAGLLTHVLQRLLG